MGKDATPKFQVKEFEGAIILKNYISLPEGQFIGLVGKVSILQDEEVVGFKASGQEVNWIARIDGPTRSVNVLGCQIRGALVGSVENPMRSEYHRVP